jgi:hypothetical protein
VDSVTGVFPVAIERNTVHCRTIPLYSYFSIPYDVFYDFPGNYLEVENESTSTEHLCHWGESESIEKNFCEGEAVPYPLFLKIRHWYAPSLTSRIFV